MNVAQGHLKDILSNQEFSDIMASIGLVLGEPVDWKKLRYSRIVFLSDSDVDGGHINTLLTNFFYTFWPELFKKGIIELAKAPLFEVVTDKGIVFLEGPKQLEEFKKKNSLKVKTIHRNKGLGEMGPEAWRYVMGKEKYTKITEGHPRLAKDILSVCFGKDSAPRKALLMDSSLDGRQAAKISKKKARKKTRRR